MQRPYGAAGGSADRHLSSRGPTPPMPAAREAPPNPPTRAGGAAKKDRRGMLRAAGGEVWRDPTLEGWDPNDYRIFCGNMGPEVDDALLRSAFGKYKSVQRVKVVRDSKTECSRGYGFVSFKDSTDYIRAMREMQGKYIGNRPVKLSKSTWADRTVERGQLQRLSATGALLKGG